jgi:hypothetical protein
MFRSFESSAVRNSLLVAGLVVASSLAAAPVGASFHLMQIEQVIGGVCGDVTQQAIQLRMRSGDQGVVSLARIRAWDAAGANPVVIRDFTTNVTQDALGSRILSLSAAFDTAQNPAADFTFTNVIPASYLPAGRLTFEDDGATIYWSLSWGGAAYTGSTAGSALNDDNGTYGPSFPGPLPWTSNRALLFDGGAGDQSTTNAADYIVTVGAATFTNNAAGQGTVVPADCIFGDLFETGGTQGWGAVSP